jgi:hypothetical protein
MGDRTILKNVISSLADSDPNVTDAEAEATLAVSVRHVAIPVANFNVNVSNALISAMSPNVYSANTVVDVTGAGFVADARVPVGNATTKIMLNFWKRNSAGLAKTNFATINTHALSANVNAFVIYEVPNVVQNTSAVNIARNATVGYDIVKSGTGLQAAVTNPAGLVFLTLKAR